MKTYFVVVVAILFILGLGLFMSACSADSAPSGSSTSLLVADNRDCADSPCSSETPAGNPVKQASCQNPVIIGSAFDQSGSMKWSGTAAITTEDMKPLLELIALCGGSHGVTFVRSSWAKPIARLRAEEPPPLPTEPIQNPDEEDYEFADRTDEYLQKVAGRDEIIMRNRRELQPKIEEYLQTLAPLLAQEPKGKTDFWTSINRLNVFLGAGNASWRSEPHRYLIIVSDAVDTIGKAKNSFKTDATVFWVNATASDKTMKDFQYRRAESFQDAVAEILAREGVK